KSKENTIFPAFFDFNFDRRLELKVLSQDLVLIFDTNTFEQSYNKHIIVNLKSQQFTNITGFIDEIERFETTDDGSFLLISTPEHLRIFNLNTGENPLNTKAFGYKLLNKQLLVVDTGKKIELYNLKTNKTLWSSEIDRSYYRSYFAGIINNNVIIVNDNQLIAMSLKTGSVTAKHTLSKGIKALFSTLYLSDN